MSLLCRKKVVNLSQNSIITMTKNLNRLKAVFADLGKTSGKNPETIVSSVEILHYLICLHYESHEHIEHRHQKIVS